MTTNTTATTILEQLGNGRFLAMTGAKMLVAGDNFLQFSIGRGAKNKANKCKVTLRETDLYDVEFFKIRGVDVVVVETVEYVFGDQLQRVFTEATGFDTRL